LSLQEFDIANSVKKFIEYNEIDRNFMNYDKKLRYLDKKLEKWLSHIDSEDKKVFMKLFEKFLYYDRVKIIEDMESLYKKYKTIEEEFSDTIFLPVVSFGGVLNGAISMIECFKEATCDEKYVSKKHIATQPQDFNNEFDITKVKNIVLIDDVIGTGDTLIDSLYRLISTSPELLNNKKIYILSLINLKKGIENVKRFSKEKEWDLRFINDSYIESIFLNENLYPNETGAREDKKIIRKYERKIASRNIDIMGYRRSEALLAFYFNTPNNTLSTFWNKVDNEWSPFFPRDKDDVIFLKKKENSLDKIREMKELKKSKQYFLAKFMNEEKQSRGIL